jgi:hypothetical protein
MSAKFADGDYRSDSCSRPSRFENRKLKSGEFLFSGQAQSVIATPNSLQSSRSSDARQGTGDRRSARRVDQDNPVLLSASNCGVPDVIEDHLVRNAFGAPPIQRPRKSVAARR